MNIDFQGWIRTALMIGAIVVGYYHDRSSIKDEIAHVRQEAKNTQTLLSSHCANAKTLSLSELDERFVTRREWEDRKNEISDLRENFRYMRDKIDAIYEKVLSIKSQK